MSAVTPIAVIRRPSAPGSASYTTVRPNNLLCAADLYVISANDTFDLAGKASAIINQDDLAFS
jgi:hypothetical protein